MFVKCVFLCSLFIWVISFINYHCAHFLHNNIVFITKYDGNLSAMIRDSQKNVTKTLDQIDCFQHNILCKSHIECNKYCSKLYKCIGNRCRLSNAEVIDQIKTYSTPQCRKEYDCELTLNDNVFIPIHRNAYINPKGSMLNTVTFRNAKFVNIGDHVKCNPGYIEVYFNSVKYCIEKTDPILAAVQKL